MTRSRKPMRQFCCTNCSRRWWTRVPRNDPVSGNDFSSFATMINPADSPCYICGDMCTPVRVKRFANDIRRRPQNKHNTHSCTGVNCYNRVQGMPARGDCVHPKSHPQG